MSFALFLIAVVVIELLLRKDAIRKQGSKPEIIPPKSKAAGSGGV